MKYKDEQNFSQIKNLPRHIAFIMDGNGRWAQKRLLPRKAGHKHGVESMKKVVNCAFDAGVKYVSVYAFSTENQKRPDEEKESLFSLIEEYFKTSIDEFIQNHVRIAFMGDLSYFSQKLQDVIIAAINKSAHFTEKLFNIGLNYGGRPEIISAVNKAVALGSPVTEESFSKLLYTGEIPDPDLIIRTGGEQRLSNFMLYQAAYSELFFTKTLWPDFTKKHLYQILCEYSERDRRFGKV